MNKIDEFSNHFHNLNLKYAERIKGFDPSGIFVEHMLAVGFSNSFVHTVLSEEEDNNLGAPTHNVGDLEMVLSTNEFYKSRKVRVLARRVPSPQLLLLILQHLERSAPVAHPSRKVTNNSSGGGGDKNPSTGEKLKARTSFL
jgi:hypothetical protein